MSLSIHWFSNDLRLADNAALSAAAARGPVLPLYILDDSQTLDVAKLASPSSMPG